MTKFVAIGRLRDAVTALRQFRAAAHHQGVQHIIPFLALKEKGVSVGSATVFKERDDFEFWDRYFEVDPSSAVAKYYDPIGGDRRVASHPHSNVATARKGTFVPNWKAASIDDSHDDTRVEFAPDYVDIIQAKSLTKSGTSSRVPLIDLAVWMLRGEGFPDNATAADMVNAFEQRFSLTQDELSKIFDPSVATEDESTFWQASAVSNGEVLSIVPSSNTGSPGGAGGTGSVLPPLPAAAVPLMLEPRVLRMARLAIASSNAVLFIGPPGTGKTTLIDQLVRDAQTDPGAFGLAASIELPLWVTPEESWSAREVLGGDTLGDDDALVFQEGALLGAIAANRWLILDEANRADLDKILGGALTWLSADRGQSVSIGVVSHTPRAGRVLLSWGAQPECEVTNHDRLGDPTCEADIEYRAGTDWRLLGTYNALDAQRVFRLGHALSRRFARVPVPPLTASDFSTLLQERALDFDGTLQLAIGGLYEAHLKSPTTALGPALFLQMGRYVVAGQSESDYSPSDFRDILCEAYVVNAGTWLVMLDDPDRDRLRDDLDSAGVLTTAEWDWVMDASQHLG